MQETSSSLLPFAIGRIPRVVGYTGRERSVHTLGMAVWETSGDGARNVSYPLVLMWKLHRTQGNRNRPPAPWQ